MNGTEIIGLVVGVVFLCLIAWIVWVRPRGGLKASGDLLKGKFDVEQGVEPADISIKNAESSSGGVSTERNPGERVAFDGIKAKKDIKVSNAPSTDRPKA